MTDPNEDIIGKRVRIGEDVFVVDRTCEFNGQYVFLETEDERTFCYRRAGDVRRTIELQHGK
jgi:hypothetical protein